MHLCSFSLITLLLTEVLDCHLKLWSLVSRSFVHEISACVQCELMHDVNWCQARSQEALNLVEWDN
jgi:hypothetical protein